mgnify:CR=1 FL=1
MPDPAINRHARHLALPQIGAEGQERIGASSALLIGVGGIGCAAAFDDGGAITFDVGSDPHTIVVSETGARLSLRPDPSIVCPVPLIVNGAVPVYSSVSVTKIGIPLPSSAFLSTFK